MQHTKERTSCHARAPSCPTV